MPSSGAGGPCDHCGRSQSCWWVNRGACGDAVRGALPRTPHTVPSALPPRSWRRGPPSKPILCNACGSRWGVGGVREWIIAGMVGPDLCLRTPLRAPGAPTRQWGAHLPLPGRAPAISCSGGLVQCGLALWVAWLGQRTSLARSCTPAPQLAGGTLWWRLQGHHTPIGKRCSARCHQLPPRHRTHRTLQVPGEAQPGGVQAPAGAAERSRRDPQPQARPPAAGGQAQAVRAQAVGDTASRPGRPLGRSGGRQPLNPASLTALCCACRCVRHSSPGQPPGPLPATGWTRSWTATVPTPPVTRST